MKIGIVGFAQSGKTTLFNALTGMNIDTSSYSGQDSANVGMARVPDERIEKLTKTLDTNVLASANVAALVPGRWCSTGEHMLNGVERPMELFTLCPETQAALGLAAAAE